MSDFLKEYGDSGDAATISMVSQLLERIPALVEAQISEKDLKVKMKTISSMFEAASKSKDIESTLKQHILLLEANIANNKETKDRYYQLIRAEHEIIKVQNASSLSMKFTKRKALVSEKIALVAMRKKLKLKDICSYLNKRYSVQLKDSCYADFVPRDMTNFFDSIKKPSERLKGEKSNA